MEISLVTLLFKNFTAKELAENSHVQDAFVIAVEQQAKERLERLSALRKIKPVDMTKLSQQVGTTFRGDKSSRIGGSILVHEKSQILHWLSLSRSFFLSFLGQVLVSPKFT